MVEKPPEIIGLQRLERVDLSTAQQWPDYLKRGILRGGAYQCHRSLLHRSEEAVLLTLVETVDLINEEERTPFGEDACGVCPAFVEHLTHLLYPAADSRKSVERTLSGGGYNPRQGSLAHPRRPPEDKRGHIAGVNHAPEHSAVAHEVCLSDVISEGAGTQALGKWWKINSHWGDTILGVIFTLTNIVNLMSPFVIPQG